jgi:hypothetical protein
MIADEGHTLKCSHLVVSKERSGDCLSRPAAAAAPLRDDQADALR